MHPGQLQTIIRYSLYIFNLIADRLFLMNPPYDTRIFFISGKRYNDKFAFPHFFLQSNRYSIGKNPFYSQWYNYICKFHRYSLFLLKITPFSDI